MASPSTSTLENSAETQLAARSGSEMPSAERKPEREMSGSSAIYSFKSGGGHIVKNKRTRYSAYQTKTLKKIFESTQYPDFEQLEAIARELALEKEVVKVWFKNQRARQKTKEHEEAGRLFLEQRNSSLPPHIHCPTPVYYFPMYPTVFPSPCQPMMNHHGNTSYFGLNNRPTASNDYLYQNSLVDAAHSLEHRSNYDSDPASCYQEELNPCTSH